MSDRCFICGEDNPTVLEDHHIIPQRLGGEDGENIVALCANCHTAIEKIYSDEVLEELARKAARYRPEIELHNDDLGSEDSTAIDETLAHYTEGVLSGWLIKGEQFAYVNLENGHPELRVNIERSHSDILAGLEHNGESAGEMPSKASKCRELLKRACESPSGGVVSFSQPTNSVGRCVGFDLNWVNRFVGGDELPKGDVP